MPTRITEHARKRMDRYGITEEAVLRAVEEPDSVVASHGGRTIAQKAEGDYVLRVVLEPNEGISMVVTVYRARRARYEI